MSIQADSNAVRHLPDKWGAVLVGLVPFAGIALMVLLFMLVSKAFQSNQQLLNLSRNILANIIIFWYLGVFIVGWTKGFPRWWYPYSLSLNFNQFFHAACIHTRSLALWSGSRKSGLGFACLASTGMRHCPCIASDPFFQTFY